MSFDAERFLTDHNIDYVTRGKHARRGWVHIECPLCSGHAGYHGGFKLDNGDYHCWRCGTSWPPKVAAALLHTSIPQAKDVLARYFTGGVLPRRRARRQRQYTDEVKLPSHGPLTQDHRDYLILRDFDPDLIVSTWDIRGIGPGGKYANRLLAPIYLNHQLISFQTRDITDRHPAKYLSASEEEEAYHHKFSLYGIDLVPGKRCAVVEGITDVWRLGPGAVGTFGTGFTPPQIWMLKKNGITYAAVFTDPDEAGLLMGEKIGAQLTASGIDCELFWDDDGNDPGDMDPTEARAFMREVLGDLPLSPRGI